MAISDIFEIGRQGMQANRQALQTTSNNVANANTPGYSRQRPVFETHEHYTTDGIRLGGGVEVPKVIRVHDQFIQKQILEESRSFGELRAKSDMLKQIEGVVQGQGTSLNDSVNKFFNDVRELSSNPEMASLRTNVTESAKNAADGFRKMNQSLEDSKASIDLRLESMVNEVNEKAREVAKLNGQIATFETTGQIPNELYDRRDNLVKDISRMTGYQAYPDERGQLTLSGSGIGVLVTGNDANQMQVIRTTAHGEKSAGSLDVFLKTGNQNAPITASVREGEMAGLIKVRDQIVNPALNHLNKVAFTFAQTVNDAHRQGESISGESRGLFKDLASVKDAAHEIKVDDAILKNPDALVTGLSSDLPGDNRVALAISKIQEQNLLPSGGLSEEGLEARHTIGESLNEMVGNIGTHSQREQELFDNQQSIMNQLENYQQSTSGVSLEEEAINLIQFQTAFNASAKALKVGDELFQTILSIKN